MSNEDFYASHISYEHLCDIATFYPPIIFQGESHVTAHVLDGAKQHLEEERSHVWFEYGIFATLRDSLPHLHMGIFVYTCPGRGCVPKTSVAFRTGNVLFLHCPTSETLSEQSFQPNPGQTVRKRVMPVQN